MSIIKRIRSATRQRPATRNAATRVLPSSAPDHPSSYLFDIYNTCRTKNLDAGEILVENQRSIDDIFVVIKGGLEVDASNTCVSFSMYLKREDAFGLIKEQYKHKLQYTIRAQTSSIVAIIKPKDVSRLRDSITSALYCSLYEKSSHLSSKFSEKSNSLFDENEKLLGQIKNLYEQRKKATSSDLVQNTIKKIPKIPAHTNELLVKLLNENESIKEVIEPILSDPSLTSMVLKTVNSSYYGLQQKISDVHHATVYLGFNAIYQIVMNDAITSVLPKHEAYENMQAHSVFISILCHDLAVLTKKSKPLPIMTVGLLHNIGALVTLLLKQSNPQIRDLFDVLDDATIGASLLRSWAFPANIYQVIEDQHLPAFSTPEQLPGDFRDEIAILYLAHLCCDQLTGTETTTTVYLHDYLTLLNLPHRDIRQLCDEAIVPSLQKNPRRLPQRIQVMLSDKFGAAQGT